MYSDRDLHKGGTSEVPPLPNIGPHSFRRSESTQKRAQSTGNHIERLHKENLDQKFGLDKKLEQFSKQKVRPPSQNRPKLIDESLMKSRNFVEISV